MKRIISLVLVIVLAFALSSTAFAWGNRGNRENVRSDRVSTASRRDASYERVCPCGYDCQELRQGLRRSGRRGGDGFGCGRRGGGHGHRDGGCLRYADSNRGEGRNRR